MKTARWEDPRVERPRRPWGRATRMENRMVWAEALGRVPVRQPWGQPAPYPRRTRGPGKNFKAGKRHDLIRILETLLRKDEENRQHGGGDPPLSSHRPPWVEMGVYRHARTF